MPKPPEAQLPLIGNLPTHSTRSNAAVRRQRLDLEERAKRIDFEPEMVYVQTHQQLAAAALAIELSEQITLDVETRTRRWQLGEVVAIQFYAPSTGKAYFVPTRMMHAEVNFSDLSIREALQEPLESRSVAKMGHELKYDIQFIRKSFGIDVANFAFDTLTASRVLNENEPHDLQALCVQYCKVKPWKISHTGLPFELWPIKVAVEYGCLDVINEYKLWQFQNKYLGRKTYRKLRDLIVGVEFPNLRLAVQMEQRGIGFDTEYFGDIVAPTVRDNIATTRQRIFTLAGKEFDLNPDAPHQIARVLFDELDLPRIRGDHVDNYALTQLKQDGFEIADAILDNRRWTTLDKMFVKQLPNWVIDGRIYATMNTTGTETGRWTMSDPNLQQIPKKIGPLIRRAFIPTRGFIFVTLDYDQGELRMMAHLSNDEGMIAAFGTGMDFHAAILCQVFGVDPGYYEAHKGDVDLGEKRTLTKNINFGTMYGMSAKTLAIRTGRTKEEAAEFQRQWFDRFPGARKYVNLQPRFAYDHGYVETILGRKRRLPNARSSNRHESREADRAAVNAPIQGSVADLVKMTMNTHADMIEANVWQYRALLNEHDEILYEVPIDWIDRHRTTLDDLKTTMENIYPLRCPMKVSLEMLTRWGDRRQADDADIEEPTYAAF